MDGQAFLPSEKDYDWLGPGTYFWENDPLRAMEWALARVRQGKAKDAYVIGAIIDVGNCLDLTLRDTMPLLADAYTDLAAAHDALGLPLPVNKNPGSTAGSDKLLRFLDCAVIRRLHSMFSVAKLEPFDSVRGLFPEGPPVYPGAEFRTQTHTQIAVINPRAIIEVFTPRVLVKSHGMKQHIPF